MNDKQFHLKQLIEIIKIQNDQVIFLIGNEEKRMEASRTCMAAISPVFKNMLYGNMMESECNTLIRLPVVEPTAFEFIINFAYGERVCLNDKNIISMIKVSDQYQIQMLSIKRKK